MWDLLILQADEANVNSFVVFLAILLLIFPILFIRSLLKGWRPSGTGGLFWKSMLIFSAPFYIGIIVIKLLSVTGLVSDDFAQLFPSLQKPAPGFPEIPETNVNFWSEYTVGLMATALIAGVAAIVIYSIFKGRESSKQKIGGLLFWGALYATAIIIANSAFDQIQEYALEGQAVKTQQRAEIQKRQKAEQKGLLGGLASDLIKKASDPAEDAKALGPNATPSIIDAYFRKNKAEGEVELGKKSREMPDTVLTQFLRLTNQQAQMLAGQDPMACQYFFHVGTFLRRFRDVFKTVNTDPKTQEIIEMIEREMANPSNPNVTPKMAPGEFHQTTTRLVDNVRVKIPADDQNFDFIDNPQRIITKRAKTQSCLTYVAFVDEISHLPRDEAIRYYRALLEGKADDLDAEAALADEQELLKLYQNMVKPDSPLDILFGDNPSLKKDFVFFLLENYEGDIDATRKLAWERKRALLDTNVKYYFALATDASIFGHLSYHSTLLRQLRETGPEACGQMAGITEETDPRFLNTITGERHEASLGNVMKSSRINQNEAPPTLEGEAFDKAEARIKAEMERSLGGSADLDILLDADQRDGARAERRACDQAEAFYRAVTSLGQAKAAAFMRGLLLDQ